MRKHALLHAGDEDHGILEALDLVEGNQREVLLLVLLDGVLLRDKRGVLQEWLEGLGGGEALEVRGHATELAEVVEAVVDVGVARLQQRLSVTRALHDLVDDLAELQGRRVVA